MFVCWPFMPIEAHLGEDDMDRWGLEPRHLREVDAGDLVEMGPEITGGFVSLGVPIGSRRWGSGIVSGSTRESKVARTRQLLDRRPRFAAG